MPSPGGTLPPEVAQGFTAGLFRLTERHPGLTTSTTQVVWNVPVIMVEFQDQAMSGTLYGGSTAGQFFERQLFDTSATTPTGSVFDYYQWVSGNRVRVVGKVVATVTLSNPKDYYGNNNWGMSFASPRNIYGFASQALRLADPQVDWRPFDQDKDGYVDVVWFVHSGNAAEAAPVQRDNLWSMTSRLSSWPSGERYQTLTPMPGAPLLRISIDRFSVMPELSAVRHGQPSEIGVYCHEFGHALGLPDLYDTSIWGGSTNAGPGNWNLMATGGYGANGGSPEYPSGLGAWSLLYLGWRNVIRPTTDTVLVQTGIARGDPIVEFSFQGESNPEHFLIEHRRREGFDRNIPGEGLLLYHVNEAVMAAGLPGNQVNSGTVPGLRLVEADGTYDIPAGRNRGDPGDPFPGPVNRNQIDDGTTPNTRSFAGSATGMALREIIPVGDAMHYRLEVLARGWDVPVPASTGAYNPILPASASNRAVRLSDGTVALVTDELIAGRAQVMLRMRRKGGTWDDPIQVSASPTKASDPTIAALPGGSGLVFVWSDSRDGAGELYYRSRIGGFWTSERRLTDLPGDSRYASVGVDRYGRVHLAWLYTPGATPQVRFMSFTYFSPFGTPLTVTSPTDVPSGPVVAVGLDGRSSILWSDRGTAPSQVWIAAYDPAIGLRTKQKIAGSDHEQPAVDAAMDSTGVVHVVWQESGPGVNQIHYQRRTPSGAVLSPYDTVVVSRGESVQNPTLRADRTGALHLAFVANNDGVSEVRYTRWQPDGGWDFSSTEVTRPADGPATRPAVAPTNKDEVSILYLASSGASLKHMERRRAFVARPLEVPGPVLAPAAAPFRLGPNPLFAGGQLLLQAAVESGSPPPEIDIFDLAGRRVTSVQLVARGDAASGEVSGKATRSWQSGVYFVRLRGQGQRGARLVVIR